MIYFDNASTTKVSENVANEMVKYMVSCYGNPSSVHKIGQQARTALQSARRRIASCLGAMSDDEIYFTSGGSEADNQAIISVARSSKKGKHIISSKFEHHAVLHTLEKLKAEGFEIELLDVNENGVINPSQVADAIREDTCLVTIMYANNEVGTIQPIGEIGKICREKGVLFHTDAVQAVGHIPIDVNAQNIDLLSLSAHKFHGAKGVGVLYARKGIPILSIIEGGGQEHGKRGGTENVPAIMGMATALEDACGHMEENMEKVTALRNRLIEGLSKIPNSYLNGDAEKRVPGTVNFSFENVEGESLLILLDEKGICASTGSACTSGSLEPSHVLLAMGRTYELAHDSIRFSLCEYNTEEEVDCVIRAVEEVVAYIRGLRG